MYSHSGVSTAWTDDAHLWSQFPLFHDTRPEIFYQYIHFVGKLSDDVTPLILSHVHSDALPVTTLQSMLEVNQDTAS